MEYVIWAKGPALGPVRSFSANRRSEKKKKKKKNRARRKHPPKLVEAAYWCPSVPPAVYGLRPSFFKGYKREEGHNAPGLVFPFIKKERKKEKKSVLNLIHLFKSNYH